MCRMELDKLYVGPPCVLVRFTAWANHPGKILESSRKISYVSILYEINGGDEIQGTLIMCISCSDRVDRNEGTQEIQGVLQI